MKFQDTPLDELNPDRVFFEGRGYRYMKPCAVHPNQFGKSFIYHSGIKYHLLWSYDDQKWHCVMIKPGDWLHFYRDSLDGVESVEKDCSLIYDIGRIPIIVFDIE